MDSKRARQQIKLWDDEYIMCRDIGHAWAQQAYEDLRAKTGEVIRHLICEGCTTERFDRVGFKSGEIVGRRYIYPPGYQTPKGYFKRGELRKTSIRAEAMRRLINAKS